MSEFGLMLVRFFRSLDLIAGGDNELAARWIQSGNCAFAGWMPLELVETAERLGSYRILSVHQQMYRLKRFSSAAEMSCWRW
jgi:hypothetical protein